MKDLPYFIPDRNDDLNVALLLLTMERLSVSKKGKLLLNNERLLIFMYLLKNPVILERALLDLGRNGVELNDAEAYSVASIAVNLDPLFDNAWIKKLLRMAASRNYISAQYRKEDGFMYKLTDIGLMAVQEFKGSYFDRIKYYISRLEQLNSVNNSSLNKLLNGIFRG